MTGDGPSMIHVDLSCGSCGFDDEAVIVTRDTGPAGLIGKCPDCGSGLLIKGAVDLSEEFDWDSVCQRLSKPGYMTDKEARDQARGMREHRQERRRRAGLLLESVFENGVPLADG